MSRFSVIVIHGSSLFYGTERSGTERNHGLNHGTERYLKIQAYSLTLLKLSL